jgi:hypothetical protein
VSGDLDVGTDFNVRVARHTVQTSEKKILRYLGAKFFAL